MRLVSFYVSHNQRTTYSQPTEFCYYYYFIHIVSLCIYKKQLFIVQASQSVFKHIFKFRRKRKRKKNREKPVPQCNNDTIINSFYKKK